MVIVGFGALEPIGRDRPRQEAESGGVDPMLGSVDRAVAALAAQQGELSRLLDGIADAAWHAPTRCDGWDVADVVLHVAQSNEMALGSATGRFAAVMVELTG